MFEVPAGGRRYRALELLVKQKRLAKTAPVPCVVRDPAATSRRGRLARRERPARAAASARPVPRLPDLAREGPVRGGHRGRLLRRRERREAAAAAGVRVAEAARRLCRRRHDRSSSSWPSPSRPTTRARSRSGKRQRSYSKEPYQIRRMLTESTVRASDRRALFVGLDAYEQAGGVVMRDLFEHDDGGWLRGCRPARSSRHREAEGRGRDDRRRGLEVDRGGCRFPLRPHPRPARTRRRRRPISPPRSRRRSMRLHAEYAKLEADYEDADELPDEVDQRLGEIEAALAAFEDRPVIYDPADIARAGVFVSIDAEGGSRSIAATSGRRTSRPPPSTSMAAQRPTAKPVTPSAARRPARRHHGRRRAARAGG